MQPRDRRALGVLAALIAGLGAAAGGMVLQQVPVAGDLSAFETRRGSVVELETTVHAELGTARDSAGGVYAALEAKTPVSVVGYFPPDHDQRGLIASATTALRLTLIAVSSEELEASARKELGERVPLAPRMLVLAIGKPGRLIRPLMPLLLGAFALFVAIKGALSLRALKKEGARHVLISSSELHRVIEFGLLGIGFGLAGVLNGLLLRAGGGPPGSLLFLSIGLMLTGLSLAARLSRWIGIGAR